MKSFPDKSKIPPQPHDSVILLTKFAPTICDCVMKNKRSYLSVISKYDERWQFMKDSLNETGTFKAETCIFDLLWQAYENNPFAVAFLKFMDDTVHRVLSQTKDRASVQVKDLVIRMVTSFGRKQSGYRNHLAEIAVIAKLQDEETHLKCVEKRLPNGCSMDFELERQGQSILVEVFSINFDIELVMCNGALVRFFEKRLLDKIQSKLNGIDEPPSSIMFVPVLWGDNVKIKEYTHCFSYLRSELPFISPFMYIQQYQNKKTGGIVYDFESIIDYNKELDDADFCKRGERVSGLSKT